MSDYDSDSVTQIETNLDDLSPQSLGAVMERLFGAGALDVWFTPIQMKKNRPGVMLSILCEDSATPGLTEIIFSETSAFGLRVGQVRRLKLARRFETVQTIYGEVTVKLGLKGADVFQIAPEYESCRAVSEGAGVSFREVHAAAAEIARRQFRKG